MLTNILQICKWNKPLLGTATVCVFVSKISYLTTKGKNENTPPAKIWSSGKNKTNCLVIWHAVISHMVFCRGSQIGIFHGHLDAFKVSSNEEIQGYLKGN